ncbi:MAG: TonB-dependent receptor [Bacteroidaceae bacterium]|nr:TonB-dependent receptor [Bacteroidaceae bacterium]
MYTFPFRKREVITFRQFRRTGWALFAALGREVRIGVLSVGTLLAAAPCLQLEAFAVRPVGTDEDIVQPGDTIPLTEATVAASRAPMAAGIAARQVTTLTRDDIAAAGVTAVSDALKLAAGIDVRQRGGFGIQTDISINGGTFDQLALLVNGIPYGDVQTGHNAAQFPFALADIERIEVFEGAASRIFGSQAFSGAINVVTRQRGTEGRAELQAGSYGTLTGAARQAIDSGGGRFHTSLSVGGSRSDGAVKNGDFKGAKVYWQGVYDGDDLRLHVQAGHVADDFGANTFYSPANDRQWEATRRTLVSARADARAGGLHLQPELSWTRTTDHYQWVRGTHDYENFNRTDVYHLGLNAWGQWILGRTAVGAGISDENLLSGNLGTPMDESRYVRIPGQDGIYYTRNAHRTNVDVYLEHNVVLRRWTFSAGLLGGRSSALDHRFHLYPGVDVSWRPGSGWRLFASWNKALRLPTFTDLWYKSPSQQGNVGLRPERNAQARVGAEWARDGIAVSLKGFHSRGRDMIDWVMYSPTDVYHAAAFRLHSLGASVSARADLRRWLGSRQPLRRLLLEYAYVHQRRKDDAYVFRSNYAMNHLRNKFVATLSHDLPAGLRADWTLRVQNRAGAYQVYEGLAPTDRTRHYGTYALLDVRLSWQRGRYALSCDLSNVTCRRYVDVAGVPQPRLVALVGGSVRW